MLFDHCAECQRCCNVEPGYPSLEITLTRKEENGLAAFVSKPNVSTSGHRAARWARKNLLAALFILLATTLISKNFILMLTVL